MEGVETGEVGAAAGAAGAAAGAGVVVVVVVVVVAVCACARDAAQRDNAQTYRGYSFLFIRCCGQFGEDGDTQRL
jgi:hypothetical protein